MKKYIILVSMVSGVVAASEQPLISHGIPSYSQLGPVYTTRPKGIELPNITQESNWVEHFIANPQEYYKEQPQNSHELFLNLSKKNDSLSEREYLAGRKQILEPYISELESFELEYKCSPVIIIGSGLTTFLTTVQGLGTYVGFHYFDLLRNNGVPREERELLVWVGSALMTGTLLCPIAGFFIIDHQQKKFLKRKLYERNNKDLIAMYEVVKQLTGDQKIYW